MTDEQRAILAQIVASWEHHPKWGIGRLISSAASVTSGQLRVNPLNASNDEIMSGLRALIPDDDEVKAK